MGLRPVESGPNSLKTLLGLFEGDKASLGSILTEIEDTPLAWLQASALCITSFPDPASTNTDKIVLERSYIGLWFIYQSICGDNKDINKRIGFSRIILSSGL